MSADRFSRLRTVVRLDSALRNTEVGVLLDAPLLDPMPVSELCLTSDEWASLLAQRAQAGRPLHFVEVGRNG